MGISDKNDIIYLAYDSIVEYLDVDYTVTARSNISNPVLSYLMYEIEFKSGRRYLWYDKKEHKIAVMDSGAGASEFESSSWQLILRDDFQKQTEKKEGAPLIFPVSYEIYVSHDKASLAVIEVLNGTKTLYRGTFVKPSQLNIYPYSA